MEHIYIVLQPHEIKLAESVVIRKGYHQSHNDGKCHKNEKTDEIRQDEEVSFYVFPDFIILFHIHILSLPVKR